MPILKIKDKDGNWIEIPAIKGDKGEQGLPGERGLSGVYVGSGDMPEGYNVQIDPSGENSDSFITEEELHQVKQEILNSLNYDIFGTVNEDNNIIINTTLAKGTYILKYENQDGTLTEIGSLTVGEEEVEVYNIIDVVGYYDGKRVGSSDGVIKDASTQVATGDIPLSEYVGQTITIRTKGVNFASQEDSSAAFAIMNGSTRVTGGYLTGAAIAPFTAWTRDTNGNFTSMTLPVPSDYTNHYLRMSGVGLGADLIVTINKEIEY